MEEKHPIYEEVGQRIRRIRKQRKLTQGVLADRVSLSRTSITNIEKGRQRLLLHTFAEIAEALQVEPASFLPKTDMEPGRHLRAALKGRSRSEKEWIKSAVLVSRKEKPDGGP